MLCTLVLKQGWSLCIILLYSSDGAMHVHVGTFHVNKFKGILNFTIIEHYLEEQYCNIIFMEP